MTQLYIFELKIVSSQIIPCAGAAGVLEWAGVEEAPLGGHLLELAIPGDRLESSAQDGIGGLGSWAASPSQLSQHLSSPRS